MFTTCQVCVKMRQEGITKLHMDIKNTIDNYRELWQNRTVKTLEVLYKCLDLIRESSEKPVLHEIITKETKDKTVIEKKPLATRDLFAQEFNVSARAALDYISPLKEYGLIEHDITKSYFVSSKIQKTWKWVFKLTDEGEKFYDNFPSILKAKAQHSTNARDS